MPNVDPNTTNGVMVFRIRVAAADEIVRLGTGMQANNIQLGTLAQDAPDSVPACLGKTAA
jgi:hypothetical protein